MKRTIWVIALLLGTLLAFGGAGCKKKVAEQPKTPEEAIVQLREAMTTASPQVKAIYYDKVEAGLRYGKTQDAIAALGQIAADPGLNENQKKLVNEVADLLKAKAQTP